MYQSVFGTVQQVRFNTPQDYYEFLGYLSRNDHTTRIVWENNDEQGAWGPEGRIHFLVDPPDDLGATLSHTAGVGNAVSRVNCNEYVEHIITHHAIVRGSTQDCAAVRATIPAAHRNDFDRGVDMPLSHAQ